MTAKVLEGSQFIRVGERSKSDKHYATDEYLFAPPGTIVAPRPKNEEPTPENAARAIIRQGLKLGMFSEGGAVLPAFNAYRSAKALAAPRLSTSARDRSGSNRATTARTGPPRYRSLMGAEDGAGVGPALQAIQSVANMYGVDPQTAANMLLGSGGGTIGLQENVDFAEGSSSMSSALEQLLGAANLTGPDLQLAQLAIMQAIGTVDPRAIGVTDPSKFRSLIGEGMGIPTLAKRKMNFDESLYGFSQSAPQRGNVPVTASS